MNTRARGSGGPVFLVGTPRCGSTIIYSLLGMHPDLAFIPSWVDFLPGFPVLAAANRLWDLPGMDRHRETRFFPKPVEPTKVFARLLTHYSLETLDDEVVEHARAPLLLVIDKIQRFHGKPRFLTKMTNRPVKIELLARLFPDAFFIYITRRLKPTVCSFMQVDFYHTTGPLDQWPWDVIPHAYLDYYESCGRSEEVSAAIKLKLNRSQIERQLGRIDSSRWMELRYAEFVQAPIEYLGEVAKFTYLRSDDTFVRRLKARHVYHGSDEKWTQFFSYTQVRNLDGFQALAGF